MVLYIFLIDGAFFFVAFFDASATNVLLGNKKAGERLAANNENASNAVNIFFLLFYLFSANQDVPSLALFLLYYCIFLLQEFVSMDIYLYKFLRYIRAYSKDSITYFCK